MLLRFRVVREVWIVCALRGWGGGPHPYFVVFNHFGVLLPAFLRLGPWFQPAACILFTLCTRPRALSALMPVAASTRECLCLGILSII